MMVTAISNATGPYCVALPHLPSARPKLACEPPTDMSDREEAQHLFDRIPDQRSIMTQHFQLVSVTSGMRIRHRVKEYPPSTGMVCPVIPLDAPEARTSTGWGGHGLHGVGGVRVSAFLSVDVAR